jgi:putative ABC transport system substrate-binding protein
VLVYPNRRRTLLGSLAFATAAALPARIAAAATNEPPRIGFLGTGSREGRAFLIQGFKSGLQEQGYVEGRNVFIEYRFSDDNDARLPALAAELVALNVRLIVASGTPASVAAKNATKTIPIVMGGLSADPVDAGFVASLARPGGNVTGMTMMSADLGPKRLELLKDTVPRLARVAVLNNPTNPAYRAILRELDAGAQRLNLTIRIVNVTVPDELEGAIALARERADALLAPSDPLVINRPKAVADLALKHRLPALMDIKEFAEAGGLLSLGLDLVDSYRRAAGHVAKILKGVSPADLPMEQPTQFDLVINMKTAKRLALSIPQSVLLQATRVIPA